MDDVVELIIPRDARYAATLRYVAMSLTAHSGFDVDRVEDARLAVDEAFAIVSAPTTSRIRCVMQSDATGLRATFTAQGSVTDLPGERSLGWTILRTLANAVEAAQDGTDIRLTVQIGPQPPDAP